MLGFVLFIKKIILILRNNSYLRKGFASVITALSLKLGCTMNISFILFFSLEMKKYPCKGQDT